MHLFRIMRNDSSNPGWGPAVKNYGKRSIQDDFQGGDGLGCSGTGARLWFGNRRVAPGTATAEDTRYGQRSESTK
ncbi:MAG: hypothetical protein DMG65_02950 [Candidatus Angelobacter sp. Gp1-AA117]|nr:MAG: hypothetical protein DMG65_02950 [Candidatus Angelobacter sp. Gp1-AA117]